MQHRKLVALLAVLVTAAFVAVPQGPAGAASVILPFGTQVGLQFVTPIDSSTVAVGTRVNFRVLADVMSGGRVVIRHGARASGVVTNVTQPGAFGTSAKVVIGNLATTAVDGSQVHLKELIVSKAMVSKARVGAAGAAVAGAVVLGPVGLLAGALVRGGHVSVPAGTTVTDTTDASARVITH
ncbi:MAG TPA: hypothetical protein VGX97_09975 [bacterium]|nr:hypothetical protein [bacterium]